MFSVGESPMSMANPASQSCDPSLKERERELQPFLLEGKSNKEIAVRLNITVRTVRFHVSNILLKYNVSTRMELVLLHLQPKQQHDVAGPLVIRNGVTNRTLWH